MPLNQIGASGPCSFNSNSVVVHSTTPGERASLSWATRCIRLSYAISGATHMSTGSIECSLAHSLVAIKFAYEENLMARSRTFIVPRSRSNQKRVRCNLTRYSESCIGLQIVLLLLHLVALFAHRASLLPAEFLTWFPSCCVGEAGKKSCSYQQCAGYAVKDRPPLGATHSAWCVRSAYIASKKRHSQTVHVVL